MLAFKTHTSILAIASALAMTPQAARAADAAAGAPTGLEADATVETKAEEIIVTGSLLASSGQNLAVPVDIITTDHLREQGNPTLIQLIKTIPAAASSIGESNRFLGDVAGIANINLRGFGPSRTLVLLNGRRLTPSTEIYLGGNNINFIPSAAIGRIEVLKQGGATTYGSDAVAGVVNFITRTDLEGFEGNANYSYIRGSGGDYAASLAWGWKGERSSALLTAGYKRRSELRTTDRDWALRPFAENPFGGWSAASSPGGYTTGNGGAILPNGSLAQRWTGAVNFQDDGCAELGGTIVSGTCRFNFTRFDNLVNDETHYQLYGEVNTDLSDDVKFHVEATWSRINVPNERVSPSAGTNNFPAPIAASAGYPLGGGLSPYPATGLSEQSRFYIPSANPGLSALYNTHCVGTPAVPYAGTVCSNIANYGVTTAQRQWRPFAYGGNPNYPDGAERQSRLNSAYRVSANLDGSLDVLGGIKWNAGATYMAESAERIDRDVGVNRLQLALRGLGGPSCNVVSAVTNNTPGQNGCLWLNPFANGTPTAVVTGTANPLHQPSAVPSNTNTPTLASWLSLPLRSVYENRILVGDLVVSGTVPGEELAGGPIAWAIGGQVRADSFSVNADKLSDTGASACVDSVDNPFPHGTCVAGTGVTTRGLLVAPYDTSSTVFALFAEVRVPLTDRLTISGATRTEFFGGAIGSTTNPKIDARWEMLSWLWLRGSASTTFRAPLANTTQPGVTSGAAQFTDPVSGLTNYLKASLLNQPLLQPETSTTFSGGAVVKAGGLSASLDYWRYDFKDELTIETPGAIFSTMFRSANASTWQCGNAGLASRFDFANGQGTLVNPITGTNCHPSNMLGMSYNRINGPSVRTDGLDLTLSYRDASLFDGVITVGGDATYVFRYERGALKTTEGSIIAQPIDRAGKIEQLGGFYSNPRFKGNAFVNVQYKNHNGRLVAHYVGSMKEELFPATVRPYMALDFTYGVALNRMLDLNVNVSNIFDRNPSFAYSQYNYDYGGGNPLGRSVNVGIRVRY